VPVGVAEDVVLQEHHLDQPSAQVDGELAQAVLGGPLEALGLAGGDGGLDVAQDLLGGGRGGPAGSARAVSAAAQASPIASARPWLPSLTASTPNSSSVRRPAASRTTFVVSSGSYPVWRVCWNSASIAMASAAARWAASTASRLGGSASTCRAFSQFSLRGTTSRAPRASSIRCS
jgi:hypothetical protein